MEMPCLACALPIPSLFPPLSPLSPARARLGAGSRSGGRSPRNACKHECMRTVPDCLGGCTRWSCALARAH
eukprot:6261632-Lingulodinium_polyedra.AAC.1